MESNSLFRPKFLTTLAAHLAMSAALLAPAALCQSLTVLHTFEDGADGALPNGLVKGEANTLYGSSGYGGNTNCNNVFPPYGCGNVFQISTSGQQTVLYTFSGAPDGQYPASIVLGRGKLYATTPQGGSGTGTVVEISGKNNESNRYAFKGGSDAASAFAPVLPLANGSLLGTGYFGGSNNQGALYRLIFHSQGGGSDQVLYSFKGAPNDGANPDSVPVLQGSVAYGTTVYGGSSPNCYNGFQQGCGAVYKYAGGAESLIYSFTGGTDGAYPGVLIPAGNGNFYGVATTAGNGNNGTVYQVTPTGSFALVYQFQGGPDGSEPDAIALDTAGDIFGLTIAGGTAGVGTIFELSRNGSGGWNHSVLYSFTGGADGSFPQSQFVLDANNRAVFGATFGGGDSTCFSGNGCGTIFKLTY